MFKRLFTIVLVGLMMLSAIPPVNAGIKSEQFIKNARNIYYAWGDFETEKQVEQVVTSAAVDPKQGLDKTTVLSLASGGVEGSNYALKVTETKVANKDYANFHFPGQVDEKYDVSFWLKTENKDITDISVIFVAARNEDVVTLPLAAQDGKWHQYSFTWTCPEFDQIYKAKGGTTNIRIRLEGADAYEYYLDRLSVVPRGTVDFDYSSVNVHYYKDEYVAENESKFRTTTNTNFNDISGHWAKDAITSLAKAEIVNGMGERLFAPEKSVTRAEFIKMITGIFPKTEAEYSGNYQDIAKDSWYAPFVALADAYELLPTEMKKNSKLNPNTPITRQEAASVIARAAKYQGAAGKKETKFNDEASIDDWAKTYVNDAASYGIISGYEDGSFKPEKSISRAEAAQMLLKLMELSGRVNYYVDSSTGNDKNPGTEDAPFASVEAARDAVAKISSSMKHDIIINIRGEYYFETPLAFEERHSGKNGYDIIYTSWGEEKAVFTAAKEYSGFELHDAEKNIWRTYVGEGVYSRQAYFNDVKGIRSRTVGYLENCELVNKKYYLCDNKELLSVKHPEDIDAVFHMLWVNPIYKVADIYEEDGRVRINLHKYFLVNQNRVANTDGTKRTKRSTPSYLENAYAFLDQKGEWYLNKYDGYMYYIPRDGDDMKTLVCKIPIGEKLVDARGSSYTNKVTNITLDNISFEGATWLRIDKVGGFVPKQNNLLPGTAELSNDGDYDGQSPGAVVRFEKCENITISNSNFRQLAMTGLEFVDGAKYIEIKGNEFGELANHAILIDNAKMGYGRHDRAEETYCEYININNNYIHHVAREYKTGAAVGIAYARHTKFSHNEISYTPNTGVHLNYGWTLYVDSGTVFYDVEISDNYIHDVFYDRVADGSAIYSVGGSSFECDTTPDAPNNGVNKNRITGNYLVNGWNSDFVYPDEESTSWYIANNVADKGEYVIKAEGNFHGTAGTPDGFYWMHMWRDTIKWITTENNYSTVDYAYSAKHMNQKESSIEPVKLYPDRNWPDEALAIIENAGIEPEYRDNFSLSGGKVFVSNNTWHQLEVGKAAEAGLLVLGDDNKTFPVEDYDIEWWFSDPEAVTYEDGKLTAHKTGVYEAEAWATVDGIPMQQHYMFECFDGIENVAFNSTAINLMEGYQAGMKVYAYTAIANSDITSSDELKVNISIEDKSVATVEIDSTGSQYVISGHKLGKTKITGTIEYQGETYNVDIPVVVLTHGGTEEGANMPYRTINFHEGWSKGNSAVAGGMKVSALPAHFTQDIVDNQLVAFDMEINPGSTWPSIAFCDDDFMGDYTTNNCYMIGFKEDLLELQRWNKGARTMIFGPLEYSPIAGGGVPNTGDNKVFEYNKRYSIVMGAINTDEGTRIILNINGKNIIDYTDNSVDRISAYGYFVTYNPEPGGTTFYPYTGMKDN